MNGIDKKQSSIMLVLIILSIFMLVASVFTYFMGVSADAGRRLQETGTDRTAIVVNQMQRTVTETTGSGSNKTTRRVTKYWAVFEFDDLDGITYEGKTADTTSAISVPYVGSLIDIVTDGEGNYVFKDAVYDSSIVKVLSPILLGFAGMLGAGALLAVIIFKQKAKKIMALAEEGFDASNYTADDVNKAMREFNKSFGNQDTYNSNNNNPNSNSRGGYNTGDNNRYNTDSSTTYSNNDDSDKGTSESDDYFN